MATLAVLLSWRPHTPFYYGWLVLSMVALATFAATGMTQVVLGGIQGFIFEDTGWNRTTIALAVTLGTWTAGLMSPFVGRLTDRFGPRWLMPMGAVVVAVAFFSLSEVNAIWQFYAAYILGRGIGNPVLIGVVPRTAAVNFFRRRRNFVLALNSLNRPIGSALNIQMISAMAAGYSWRAAYKILGVLSLAIIVPLIIIMRRRPEDIGLLPDGEAPQEGIPGKTLRTANPGPSTEVSWTTGEALKTRAFWLVGMTAVLALLGASTISFAMVPYLKVQAAISTTQATGVLSFSTFLAVAVLGWGYFADKFTPRRLLVFVLTISSGLTIYLLTVDSLVEGYLFGLLWGLFSGTTGVLQQMLLAQYFGRKSFGTITGALTPLSMGALGLGPFLGASIRESTGSYTELFIVLALLYLVAAVLIYYAKPPLRPSARGAVLRS